MSLADTIGKLKSVSNSESKGIFSKNNKSISSRFTNLGKLLSRNGVNAGKDPANISDSKINSVATSSKNIEATAPITDKPTSIEPSTNKPSYETLSNNASTSPNITESPSIMKGSFVPTMSPVALSPASNITKAGNNTSTIIKQDNSSVSNISNGGNTANSSTISKSNVTNITKENTVSNSSTSNLNTNNVSNSTTSVSKAPISNFTNNENKSSGNVANNSSTSNLNTNNVSNSTTSVSKAPISNFTNNENKSSGNVANNSSIISTTNSYSQANNSKSLGISDDMFDTAKSAEHTNDTKNTAKLNNTAIASSFKFDEKNNDNKLLEAELKSQTRILKDILVELKKDDKGSSSLLDLLSDLKKNKKTPSVKKPSKLLQSAKKGMDKAKNVLKRAGGAALDKLGSLANKSKGIIKTAANVAKNAAAKGMASGALQTGARVLSKALPVAAAAGTGWEAGTAFGEAIYDKYQNTDFMKGVGATVAKGAAFFGSGEAKQAVSDTTNYESKAALSEKAKANKAALQKEMDSQGMSKNSQAALMGNIEAESGFIAKSENTNYSNSSNDRIRGIFKTKTKGMSDAELTALKKDPVAFADKMYADTGGHKFRGRGLIQLTGKANYAKYSQKIFGDDRLVKNPDLANSPEVAAKLAVAYTKDRTEAVAKKKFGKSLNELSYDEASHATTQAIAGEGNNISKGYLGELAAKKNALGKKYLNEPSTDTKIAATDKSKTDKEKAIDKNVKADTTTAKTDTKVADNTKAKVADKPTSQDKSSSDRVVAVNENKKQDTKSDSKISAASKDKSKTEAKIDSKMSSSKVVAKEDRSKTEAKIDAKMASTSTEKQIDLSVGPVTTSLAPSTKLAEVDTKYIESSQTQKEVSVEKAQQNPQPQPQQVASSGGANKGAMKSAMQSNAQSSKSGEDTPNIEVRKQTSTIQRVFDRDSSLMV